MSKIYRKSANANTRRRVCARNLKQKGMLNMKKILIAILACSALAVGMTACGSSGSTSSTAGSAAGTASTAVSQVANPNYQKPENISTADDAQKALEAGNRAYKDGNIDITATDAMRQDLYTNGQKPYATVVTCSDSRVPPELIFNSGLGELFTIRTAGNVIADFETGSVEYSVDHLGTQLVVVMGHTNCGAVAGAIEGHATGHVEDIIEDIRPSVEQAKQNASTDAEVASLAETYNVQHSIAKLRESEILAQAERDGKIKIVGALYNISTGEVQFL